MGLVEKFGDLNKRVKKKIVGVIESYDEQMQKLTDEELRAKTEGVQRASRNQKMAMKVLRLVVTRRHLLCREGWLNLGMKHFRVKC